MAFHVPFEYRRRAQPIYIGFDVPPRRKRQRNWTGVFGFLLSILGIMTAGVLSPIALLVNLFALRKSPRGLAGAGAIVSLVGSLILGSLVFSGVRHHQHVVSRKLERINSVKADETLVTLQQAADELTDFAAEHDGLLPDPITANMLAIKYDDAWGQTIRFDAEKDRSLLRSPGPDSTFDTSDDVTHVLSSQATVGSTSQN